MFFVVFLTTRKFNFVLKCKYLKYDVKVPVIIANFQGNNNLKGLMRFKTSVSVLL